MSVLHPYTCHLFNPEIYAIKLDKSILMKPEVQQLLHHASSTSCFATNVHTRISDLDITDLHAVHVLARWSGTRGRQMSASREFFAPFR